MIGIIAESISSDARLTAGDAVKFVQFQESVRQRTWCFFATLLTFAHSKLESHRDRWQQLHSTGNPDAGEVKLTQNAINRTSQLVDRIAMQLYFASGAYADGQEKKDDYLTEPQKQRFWSESADPFSNVGDGNSPAHGASGVCRTLQGKEEEVGRGDGSEVCKHRPKDGAVAAAGSAGVGEG